ncbi:Holliday junction resolvase RuvX [Candidatus Babeliales bacterium]|nr:Holliday junction resolvase RuvX [Candidatus Babeliales bacterium]MCF7899211.1 Holliday junction resolvase RuvX [Candidatus Babeliales bacterium]
MKILALDLGDKWVGSAISDGLGISCRPYKTVDLNDLDSFLSNIIEEENIQEIVIGYPQTLSGTQSEQTKKILSQKENLEQKFNNIKWILFDERLSSKRAENLLGKKYKEKQKKIDSHSIAAAFILQNYLDKIFFNK